MTFVTIGLTIHDGFCRKPSADIPVRAHRVSSLSLGAQLTVSVPHQPCSWSVSGDSSGTIADFPPICADCGVRYSEAQSSPAPCHLPVTVGESFKAQLSGFHDKVSVLMI